jgi:ubiquinone/menaquinone biosynthesis C-methylase UbiE
MVTDKEKREKEESFFDRVAEREKRIPIYSDIDQLGFDIPFKRYFDSMLGDLSGKRVLEYGCGNYGDLSVKLARSGAEVVAVDLSFESIKSTRSIASQLSLPVRVMKIDCEALPFIEDSFDLVVGRAILHHLDLSPALSEIHRVLRKNGRGLFIEPLGTNPLINLYRKLTPQNHTPDEHPLKVGDFQRISNLFTEVIHQEFNFLPLGILALARFFSDKSRLAKLVKKLQDWDNSLFRYIPALKWYCWTTVISFRK